MNVIRSMKQVLMSAGLAVPKTMADYIMTPYFKVFSAAQ